MAVNQTRSLNNELREGLSDGVVKKYAPSRGGDVTSAGAEAVMMGILPQDRYDPAVSTAAAAAVANRQTTL